MPVLVGPVALAQLSKAIRLLKLVANSARRHQLVPRIAGVEEVVEEHALLGLLHISHRGRVLKRRPRRALALPVSQLSLSLRLFKLSLGRLRSPLGLLKRRQLIASAPIVSVMELVEIFLLWSL